MKRIILGLVQALEGLYLNDLKPSEVLIQYLNVAICGRRNHGVHTRI